MKFLIAITFALACNAKNQVKKLDLTTISKPAPKVEAEPILNEANATTEPTSIQATSATTTRDGYTAIDFKTPKDVNTPIKTGISATVKCRATTGLQYLPTDAGFETCLKQNEIEKARASIQDKQNPDHIPGQSVELSFGESN